MKTKKLKLYGFNNLTKTLSFNIYDICYAVSDESRRQYIEYIDEQYNAERLTNILRNVSDIIGAHILNVASQDYDPQGASVTILISEEEVHDADVVCHLDKSHLTVHTYPEKPSSKRDHDLSGPISTYRRAAAFRRSMRSITFSTASIPTSSPSTTVFAALRGI